MRFLFPSYRFGFIFLPRGTRAIRASTGTVAGRETQNARYLFDTIFKDRDRFIDALTPRSWKMEIIPSKIYRRRSPLLFFLAVLFLLVFSPNKKSNLERQLS